MSKQALTDFRKKLSEDEALRADMAQALKSGDDKTGASVEDVVAFAKAKGYDFTPAEVGAALELTDADLEAVSGGAIYMKYDGVDGESSDGKHRDWIDVLSFSL